MNSINNKAQIDKSKLQTVLVTDCGSTTTKALLFEKTPQGWRQTFRGEAPTTVEDPVANVTVGARNAFVELEELSGRKILNDATTDAAQPFISPSVEVGDTKQGIDLYLSSSSAGGGLQMMVAGVVGQLSTESANRAALGAGAIVLDALSVDDGREDFQRIERVRHLRPDIVLLTGGVDGGASAQVIELAEILRAAAPRPRFGDTLKLPVIYAGNRDNSAAIKELLDPIADVIVVPNVRPTLSQENLAPARAAIHDFFLSHVMSHSPGYATLLSWSPQPVMPTPAAVGDMVQLYAQRFKAQVLCADIGGATTDVFSVFNNREEQPIFNRTVSANFGMSYSIANVLVEAGVENIVRWLPYKIAASELRDRLRNKMIRPTSIPQTKEDLWLEQAVCREALRLSLAHHRSLAVGLSGVTKKRGISGLFSNSENRYELVNLAELDIVIGSGGVLSHAPQRLGAALMMIDGFGLWGVTELAVDSIFMMPHLGVFASIDSEAAQQVFLHDCIVPIATHICPKWSQQQRELSSKDILAEVVVDGTVLGMVQAEQVEQIDCSSKHSSVIEVRPSASNVDVGAGPGKVLKKQISRMGIFLLDGRSKTHAGAIKLEWERARQERVFSKLGLL